MFYAFRFEIHLFHLFRTDGRLFTIRFTTTNIRSITVRKYHPNYHFYLNDASVYIAESCASHWIQKLFNYARAKKHEKKQTKEQAFVLVDKHSI